ncbi:MAG: tandem-95 repeat protein, partial [Caldilineaceae bacterium]|nr:tandem-95 repeat protein [Caldilineaceae bacterium]
FTYQICDNGEPVACATGTVNVLVVQLSGVNTAYAFNDAAYVRAGGTVTGNVLANDVDPEADGWQRPVVVEQPLHGDVTLADNGDFSYRADADYVGDDGWSYQVCDNGVPVVCATAAVVVTVVPANQGPLAVDDVAHTPINTPVSGSVLTNDLDPDGAALTVAGNPVNGPENGTVSLGSDGLFVYTPNAGFTGPDRFVYEVCDSDGRCSQAQVRIDVRASNMANAAPYAQSDLAVTAVGRTVTINVLANDQDLDGAPDPASVSVVTPAEFGTATVNRDGTMSYLPNAEFAFAGSDTFGYQVCDNGAPVLCATASVTVTLADTTRNRTYAFGDTAWGRTNQPIAGMVLENDLDLEGDTQSVKTDPVTNPSHGTATLTADGRFTYTPARDFTGTDTFTYRVCDDGAPQACATGTVTLYVLPPNLGWDFGDALGYSTTLVVDGPRHALVGGLALGTKVDAEHDAMPDEQATTDDRAGGDTVGGAGDVVTQINDEAAIVGYPTYTNNGRYRLDIVVTNATAFPAQLVGWIDWNANFSFDDEGERSLAGVAFTDAPSGSTDGRFTTANIPAGFSGTVTLTWRNFATLPTPSAAKMVRLRLAADLPGSEAFFASAGPTPTGAAIGGAVVDTLAPISTQAVAVDSFTARRNGETVYFDWTTAYGTDLAGFNLLAEVAGELEQINSTLVPGVAVNSTLPAAYDFSGVTAGETFYLEVVLQSGERYLVGPILLGGTPRLYLPIVMGR